MAISFTFNPFTSNFDALGTTGQTVTTYATFSAFPSSAPDGTLALALDTDILYAYSVSSTSWLIIGGPGTALSVGTVDSGTPSTNGAHIDSDKLIMQSASASNPGLVNTTTQTFSGNKNLSVLSTNSNTARTLSNRFAEYANVLDFGAVGDGTTNDTAAIISALSASSTLYFPPGNYVCTISIQQNNVTLIGDSSATTTLTAPAGSSTNVVNIGDFAAGNSAPAYSYFTMEGFTINGNESNVTRPTDDTTGWGVATTNFTYIHIRDVISTNCWTGGGIVAINSNYADIEMTVSNNGIGSIANGPYPGFDVNSSSYSKFKIISIGCQYGARLLDNCFGNYYDASIFNAINAGFIYNNQSVNQSYSNTIIARVEGGCSNQGFSLGINCYASNIIFTGYGLSGCGFQASTSGSNQSNGNTIEINTYNGQIQSALIQSNYNHYTINSNIDGRSGAAGSVYAVDIYGNGNTIKSCVIDTTIEQVRNIAVRSGATGNTIITDIHNNAFGSIDDSGTNTIILPNGITSLTGDGTASGPGSAAFTLATVNTNTGAFGSSTSIPSFAVNGKGLITAASGNVVIAPAGTLSGTTLNGGVVSSSLTSVGTITSGIWNGTTIDVAHGGTGSTIDIAPTSFSAANNISSPANVTGLTFSNASVRSADILLSVFVNATSSLYQAFKMLAIQRGSDWQLYQTAAGDSSGFVFTITSAGQVQYTNSNYTGFSAATIKFRAQVTSV